MAWIWKRRRKVQSTWFRVMRWRTPDVPWMDHEGATEREVVIINVVNTAKERLPRCLTSEEELLAWKERKECERRKKIEAGEYVTHRRGRIYPVGVSIIGVSMSRSRMKIEERMKRQDTGRKTGTQTETQTEQMRKTRERKPQGRGKIKGGRRIHRWCRGD
jgi:hypothetical protein